MEDGTPVVNQIGTGASAVFPQGVPHAITGLEAHRNLDVLIKLHALKPRFERPERATHCYSLWSPGLLHYQQNLDCYDSTYIITYNSEDPGTQVRQHPRRCPWPLTCR